MFRCLRTAVRTARVKGFGVAHFSILSNHIHLVLEPTVAELGPMIQSFSISFAKRFNRVLNRTGAVFLERYHLHVLRTPTEVKNALSYVLTNESRHLQGKRRPGVTHRVRIDPFSSAHAFEDWKKLLPERILFESSSWSEDEIESWYAEILMKPKTWLLTRGWRAA